MKINELQVEKKKKKKINVSYTEQDWMSLAVHLVKKETRSLSSVNVANRDPLIESRIYISLSPSLPPRSLVVDRGKDWLEN